MSKNIYLFLAVLNCERMLLDCHQAIQSKGKASETIFTAVVVGSFGSGKSSFVDRLVGRPCHTGSSFAKKAVRIEVTKPSDESGIKPKWKFQKTLHEMTATVAEKLLRHTLHHPKSAAKPKESLGNLKFGDMPAKEKLLYYDTSLSKITTPFQAITSCYKVKDEFLATGVRVNQCPPPLKGVENTWTHYIMEVEGLPQFQKLFPNMMPCPSLYYYVFRADHDLNGKLRGEYKCPGEASAFACEASVTNRDAILQFLAGVASMKAPQGPQGGSFAPPKVLFIATHVDKLKSNEEISQVDQELQKIVKGTQAYKDGLIVRGSESCMLLAVNSQADDDDRCKPDFQKVRSVVERVATTGDDYRVEVPYTWSLFSATIQHCPDPVLSLSKCLKVGKECGISQRGEMVKCLSFLHRLGVLCYFEGIAEVVFRDPQFLYDKVASLISSTLGSKGDGEIVKGIYTAKDLQSLLSCSEVPSCSELTKLLQQACVVASLCSVDMHFIPCSLACAMESGEDHSASSHCRLPPLHFTFSCNYLPLGFAEAFMASFSSASEGDCKLRAISEINQDQISFVLGPHSDKCLFSFRTTVIRVEVFPSDAADRGTESVAVVCCWLRQHIECSLQHATKRLNLDPKKSDRQAAFYCPNTTCCADTHLAEVDSKVEGLPTLLKCIHSTESIALPSSHLVWYDKVGQFSSNGRKVNKVMDYGTLFFEVQGFRGLSSPVKVCP